MVSRLIAMKLTARQIERFVKQGEIVHTECKDASGGLLGTLWESYRRPAIGRTRSEACDQHENVY